MTDDASRRLHVVNDGPGRSRPAPDRPERPGEPGARDGGDAGATGQAVAERIRERAGQLGFDQVGLAPAEPPAHGDWFREWLERGWHGEMGYMAREDTVRRRMSLEEALPGCRSVVVVSMTYAGEAPDRDPRGGDRASDGQGTGRGGGRDDDGSLAPVVARYARGRDYHRVFEERLEALAATIRHAAPDAEVKPYVDHGPVLEREHAQRAGLGWIGKNTVLIDPRLGSYLLLGELLTTLELPADDPFTADRCGSCTRCIEACPTDAIRGPRRLDARRCISYLTIELDGPIPVELRPLVGNRVFGCDICQEVCPWNRDVPEHDHADLEPGRPAAFESMVAWAEELLELSPAAFRDRYGDTALARPGREAMLRNLCVGLGNSGRPEAVPVLRRCRDEGSALVREHAGWALRALGAA